MRLCAFREKSKQVLKFELAFLVKKTIESCKIYSVLVQVALGIFNLSLVLS
jgi:hypothetical protein